MATHHDPIELTSGDDWLIEAALVDDNGNAIDLTNVTLMEWVLINPQGVPCASASGFTITNATGGLLDIAIPNAQTIGLYPGVYHDALRTVSLNPDGTIATQWVGTIMVDANTFLLLCDQLLWPQSLQSGAPILDAPTLETS